MKNSAAIVWNSWHRHISFCPATIWRAACGAPEKAANAAVLLFLVLHKHTWYICAKTKPLSRPVAPIVRPESPSTGTAPTTPRPAEGLLLPPLSPAAARSSAPDRCQDPPLRPRARSRQHAQPDDANKGARPPPVPLPPLHPLPQIDFFLPCGIFLSCRLRPQ